MPEPAYHPWRALRDLQDVEQLWESRQDRLGASCPRTRRIWIRTDLTQAERRCTLAHELVHLERGDVGECDDRIEAIVHREAARRLLPISLLLDVIAFHGENWPAVAVDCWVDDETLDVRLQHAHPSEKGAIRRCLALREESA